MFSSCWVLLFIECTISKQSNNPKNEQITLSLVCACACMYANNK